MRCLAGVVAACLAWDVALAADLREGTFVPIQISTQSSLEPAALEWVSYEGPWTGRRVVATVNGASVRTIEWRLRNEVRVRTGSGAALTNTQRRAVTDLALNCRQGKARDPVAMLELNGTFVVEYDCARLQGQ